MVVQGAKNGTLMVQEAETCYFKLKECEILYFIGTGCYKNSILMVKYDKKGL